MHACMHVHVRMHTSTLDQNPVSEFTPISDMHLYLIYIHITVWEDD